MSLLEFYETEFRTLSQDVKESLNLFSSLQNESQITETASQIDSQISELRSHLASYDMELQHCSMTLRNKHKDERKQMEQTVNEVLRKWLLMMKRTDDDAGKSGDGCGGRSCSGIPSGARRRAELAVEKLSRGSDQLHNCKQLVAETESIGDSVLEELYVQREAILRTKHKVRTASANIDDANSLIDRMSQWWASFIS